MKRHLIAQSWPAQIPMGVKRTVMVCQPDLDVLAARRQYAAAHGLTLLDERPDGLVALYWDEAGRLLRLAFEPVG